MDQEVAKVTDHLRMQSAPQYNDEIISQPVHLNGKGGVVMDFDHEGGDDMFRDAVQVVVRVAQAHIGRKRERRHQRHHQAKAKGQPVTQLEIVENAHEYLA